MLPPGPRLPALAQVVEYVRRPLPFLDACARRYGKRFTIKLGGGRSFVLTWDKDDVKAVFTGAPEVYSGKGNERFKTFVGEHSLFVLGGREHERHRRLIGPAFRGERMRAYGSLMSRLTLDALARAGRTFRIEDLAHGVALRAILRAIFGVEDRARERALGRLLGQLTSRASAALLFVPALQVDLGAWSPWGKFLRARAALDALIFDEIRRARAEADRREDVLARLIVESAADPLTDQELRDELLTLLGAGHETTTAGLAWAFRFVLGDPTVRARVEEEVRALCPGGELDVAVVPRLKYVEACVNETLRLLPPVPIVPRRIERTVTLGGFELPEGTYVAPSPYLAQRDPAVYPDPLRFDPERFHGRRPGPYEYFPFGGGTRICIGLPFAIFEMKVVIATILANASLDLAGRPTLASRRKGIIVVPRDGTRVTRRAAPPGS